MKLSFKFQDDPFNEDQHRHRQIMTAKVPITVLNQPFISGVTATTTHLGSDFSFSLTSDFPSGPSFKLSYSPTSSFATVPFSLSLKSGLGIFGSPRHSPLVFSANFSLSPSKTIVPTFFLHFKPQFGHFSLNKTVFSDPNSDPISASFTNSKAHRGAASLTHSETGKGFMPGDSASAWQELKLEPFGGKDDGTKLKHMDNSEDNSNGGIGFASEKSLISKNNKGYGVSSGIAVMARTVMPVTKGLSLNLRWGVNFPWNSESKMPYLTVNKIGLERVEELTKNEQSKDISDGDLQLLKGMCFWMRRDLENVEKENREMKRILDQMTMGVSARNHRDGSNGVGTGKKVSQHSSESSSEFERWRSKRSGREENGQREPKKPQSLVSDVESELQKAIKVASS